MFEYIENKSARKLRSIALKAEVFNILTGLLSGYLPNLEEFGEKTIHSYVPVLNALQDSHLKHLKKLGPYLFDYNKSDVANYATCVIFLKDRIESVEISDDYRSETGISEEQLSSTRLYDRLGQFEKMKQLTLFRKTIEDIQTLEYVIDSCKAMNHFTFTFNPLNYQFDSPSNNSKTPLNTISTFIPTTSIKSLTAKVNVSSDYKILLYLMHKFPQLDHFCFTMDETQSAQLSKQILTQLLNYSLKIDSFYALHLRIDHDTISETLGDHWDSVSAPGSECLELVYSYELSEGQVYVMDISKQSNERVTSFKYPMSDETDLRYVDFIQKNGKFINELQFKLSTGDGLASDELPGGFMTNAFTHCPNLQKLFIEEWVIRRFSHSRMDLRKKLSINEIHFNRCIFYPGALEQLSFLLHRVNVLFFEDLFERETGHLTEPFIIAPGEPDHEIVMPYTEIDCIIFHEDYFRANVHLKIFEAETREYYYYRFVNKSVKASNEQKYIRHDNDARVYICCKTKPNIQLIRNSYCILNC